jgi:Tol biopolymer transport system component
MVDLTSGEVSELLAGPSTESAAMISPSGRWVAYQSDETGSAEIFVRPFPDVDGGRWQISQGLGMAPAWGSDDSAIVYFEGKAEAWAVVSVAVDTRDGFRVGARRTLFTVDKSSILPPGGTGWTRSVDLHPDGERVLLMEIVDDEQPDSTEVILVQNFVAELERLAPRKN